MELKNKWRHYILLSVVLAMGSLLNVSCFLWDHDDDPEPPTLEVNPTSISFTADKGDKHDLVIKCSPGDATWTVLNDECQDWLNVSTISAKGDMTITLTTTNDNEGGDVEVEMEVQATNEEGEASAKIKIHRDGIPDYKDNYVTVAAKLVMSYGMACAAQWGNATTYFLYNIYTANDFSNLRGNRKKIVEEASKNGSNWTRVNIPSSGGVEILYDKCLPATDYVFVAVPFTANGTAGQITVEDFKTKDANELNQLRAPILPMNTYARKTHNGDDGPWYEWDITGAGTFYITYACASDKLVETMQNRSGTYGEFNEKNGLMVAWNIFMESKRDDLSEVREVHFNKDNTNGREMIIRGTSSTTQWINYRETDKYLQIVTWVFKDSNFDNYSGIVYDLLYEVKNGKLIPTPRPEPDPFILVDPNPLNFSAEGGTLNASVEASGEWLFTNYAEWLTVTKSADGTSLSVKANKNETYSQREHNITLKLVSSDYQIIVPVKQEPSPQPDSEIVVGVDGYEGDKDLDEGGATTYTLVVSPSSLSTSPSGETKNVTVTSNDSWTVSSNQSWCTVSATSGSNNGTVRVTTTKNTTSSSRTATVTFSGAHGGSQTVTVTQEAYSLTASTTSMQLSSDGDSKTVSVTSNDSWTVTSSESWCTVSPSSGSNNGTITIKAASNNSQERYATVTIKGTNSGKTVTVSVTQGAGTAIGRDEYGNDKEIN